MPARLLKGELEFKHSAAKHGFVSLPLTSAKGEILPSAES